MTFTFHFPFIPTFDQQPRDNVETHWRSFHTYCWTFCSLHSKDTANATLLLNFPVCSDRQLNPKIPAVEFTHSHRDRDPCLFSRVQHSHIHQRWRENCFSHINARFGYHFCKFRYFGNDDARFILAFPLDACCLLKHRLSNVFSN